MTDETNGTTPAETPAFAFEAVAAADIPKQDRGATPASIAMGKALLAVLANVENGGGARDPHAETERKQAVNRAQVIKRAVKAAGGVPKGKRLATSIESREDGYHVIASIVNAEPAKAAKA